MTRVVDLIVVVNVDEGVNVFGLLVVFDVASVVVLVMEGVVTVDVFLHFVVFGSSDMAIFGVVNEGLHDAAVLFDVIVIGNSVVTLLEVKLIFLVLIDLRVVIERILVVNVNKRVEEILNVFGSMVLFDVGVVVLVMEGVVAVDVFRHFVVIGSSDMLLAAELIFLAVEWVDVVVDILWRSFVLV